MPYSATTDIIAESITEISSLRQALLAGSQISCACDHIPAVLVPKDMIVQDLEHLLPAPARMRGNFGTSNLDDFLAYCAQNLADDTVQGTSGNPHIFYTDLPNPRATAILDYGHPDAPAWGQHRAIWFPQEAPALVALRGLLGKALDQDTLTAYLDDWTDYLAFERQDGTPISVAAARGAIADLSAETIKSLRSKTGDFSRERSALEKIAMAPTVPNRLILTSPSWVGFGTHQLSVRIAAADSATLALRLTLIGWPLHQEQLMEELRQRLEAIEAPITVLCGTV